MVNPFNLGHALPLPFGTFSCCARTNALAKWSGAFAASIFAKLTASAICDAATLTRRDASLLELLHRVLPPRHQSCFLNYE